MKFSTTAMVFAVILCVASFAEAKPTLITKKIIKKYVVPRVLSGEWKFPSLYVPYPLSLWLSGAEAANSPTVVYHSLPEDEVETVKDFNAAATAQLQQQQIQHQPQLPNEIDVRGPIYIAETPAVRHVAPLPQGYTEDVHTVNVQPAPGTTVA